MILSPASRTVFSRTRAPPLFHTHTYHNHSPSEFVVTIQIPPNPYHVTTTARLETPVASKPNTIMNLNIRFDSFYRVVLIYSNWTDDKATARLVLRAIPSLKTVNTTLHIVRSARSHGKAIVVTAIKDEAKQHVRALARYGLDADLEEA